MMKRQISCILSTTVGSAFYSQLESYADGNTELSSPWPTRSLVASLEHPLGPFPIYSILQSKINHIILQRIPSTFPTHNYFHCREYSGLPGYVPPKRIGL